eukprot:CAMPEP_0117439394 /NCGR_PEP_ID=MMETSP0759-20121206/2543_1 /TAXON_ID=63605 /ORGANISM="Percolomonas cosmopolitus, Strain WS" /LENGTH=579 /DNA_ID=CAMNT_0005231109 /DNA_START=44 /DNA_END=1783 /DNA_ORIENTATION=-
MSSSLTSISNKSANVHLLQSFHRSHGNDISADNHSDLPTSEYALNGESLTPQVLYHLAHNSNIKVTIDPNCMERINNARKIVDHIVENTVIYGVNTGFGLFSHTNIETSKLEELQYNLIRSHATGVGSPIPLPISRILLILRINVLLRGNSGIRLEIIQSMVEALNKNCISLIPEKGSVGASGDLAPLSHLALGLLGEGKMWNPTEEEFQSAAYVLEKHGLQPIKLSAKEGLSLINGTQFICAYGIEALQRAKLLVKQADAIGALTLENLLGSRRAFDPRIHMARPHNGQQLVAWRLRNLLVDAESGETSEMNQSHNSCGRVQDSYTLRCMPQVHGVVNDTIKFVDGILSTEINSSTDNPMVFYDDELSEEENINSFYSRIVSGGNFHGEYPGKMMDYLAIAVHELANISERRTARLIDNTCNEGLPAFLVRQGGLNSGFMLVHCTAAALTSENKVLVHPASSDTLPTSANKEDHVSMSAYAARKALTVVENVEHVLACELMAACQALDLRRPLRTTPVLEEIYNTVREKVEPIVKDRYLAPDIEAIRDLIRDGAIWKIMKKHFSNLTQDHPVRVTDEH